MASKSLSNYGSIVKVHPDEASTSNDESQPLIWKDQIISPLIGVHRSGDYKTFSPITQWNRDKRMSTEWDIEFQEFVHSMKNRTSKLVLPGFILLGLGASAMFAVGFVDTAIQVYMTLGMIGFIVIGSILGMIGVYYWGTVVSAITTFKQENKSYENDIIKLHETSNKLDIENNKLLNNIENLRKNMCELENQLKGFDNLRNELMKRSSESEEIGDIIDHLNDMSKNIEDTMLNDQKASYFELFYDAAFRKNGDPDSVKLTQTDYKRYLARLSKDAREKFAGLGTWQEISGVDGKLDITEFKNMIDKMQNIN